jgi:hypothetical protein
MIQKKEKKIEKIKRIFHSVKAKLFITLCATVLCIIIFLIILNSFALEKFYLYSKENTLKDVYKQLNDYYNGEDHELDLESELEKIAIKNNFDILIKDEDNMSIYNSNKNFYSIVGSAVNSIINEKGNNLLESSDKYTIFKQKDFRNGVNYVMLSGEFDNGYYLYIRIPVSSIKDSVRISNNFLIMIAGFTILISAIMVSVISRKFTEPILELNKIAQNMANLDFSHKYKITDADDEINNLGKSINTMSDKLERTINQLRSTNVELERDIEKKSKIDEMRKSFISDVSHELKTPIALIQGYSEGLLENVNSDEESRKFYAEVILDETNKMDKLVKQLLELMKLEYGKREFNNREFDIVELEKAVIQKSKLLLEEKKVKVILDISKEIKVFADDFYIEQVITNYLTNAIKNVKEIDGEKYIKIENENLTESNVIRIKVFNTGENISEENLERIWKRFYKVDESRNRSQGGTGIGLAFVKAIMTNYNMKYGVINCKKGIEFYFELTKA